jgi:puromycin-sensitive aminopeptidase
VTDTTTDAGTDGSSEPNPYRLPRTVVPVRYELTLEPDLGDASFSGTEAVEIDVLEPTSRIVLNAIELEIHHVQLTNSDGQVVAADNVVLDDETERMTIETASAITPGRWVLHAAFTGILNDKLHGFYRSTFTDSEGAEQVIATTQFEATDARRAFPCWDEPDLKAVFAVTLVVDRDLAALSNAAELSRTPRDDGRDVVRFADTIVMSTYLVAFIVGPLDVTEPVIANGKPLRVAYPRGKGHLTGYALEVGRFALEFFADYYAIDYPGDKLDLVAVPDFAFGAMENLGCVTFREVLVLVDPERATQPELSRVTDVIAHELAHMWFGDLVTMKWWNGIWLNEAFATFMEMLCADAFRPEWDRWTTFGLARTAAFDVDALKTTRPIEFPVVSPTDAEGMFDILTYEKGAAVVRMLEQYLGAERFRDGIRSYLDRHRFGNTETTDLWDALEETTGEPVRRIMDSWIFQGGFPVIDVDLLRDEIDPTVPGTVRFTQQRYRYASDIGEGDPAVDREQAGETWVVPLLFSLKGTDGVVALEKGLLDEQGLEVPLLRDVEWVLANTEGTGFYRARYDRDLLAGLTAGAQKDLSPIERYGVVDDAWAAVLAGELTTVDFLGLAERFANETDLSVWERLVAALGSIDRFVEGPAREAFRATVRGLVRPALDRLGPEPVDGESDRDRELRGTLLGALGSLGNDDAAQARARELYARDTEAPGSVDPSLVAAAVGILAATGGTAEFDDFLARSRGASTPQEELRFLSVLADFDHADLMGRVLAMSLTDEVRTQNAPYLLRRCLVNRDHGPHAWRFVAEQWESINARFPSNSIVRLLEGIRSLSKPADAAAVFRFFETHEVPQGDKTLAQHLERLEVNVALRRREEPVLAAHLT